jgi:hypothetical protein
MQKEDWVVAAPVILTVAGLEFTVHNNGQHIVVSALGAEFHLWPSTGKWRRKRIYVGSQANEWSTDSEFLAPRYRGVRGLVMYLKDKEK